MTQRLSDTGKNRSIYRADAVMRYARGTDKSVLPRFVSPRTVMWLWVLLGLLLAASLVAFLSHVPMYASGPAIVVESTTLGQTIPGNFVVVAFFSPDNLSRLRAGQNLFIDLDGREARLIGPTVTVEPEVISPEKARKRFLLSGETSLAITHPVVVAIAQLGPSLNGLPISTYAGSIYHANVEVGSRRAISFLPLMDHLLRE